MEICTNCGNTTEATTLLQHFIKKITTQAVNFVMRLIEEGQTHLGLESGSGRAADDAEEEEEEVEELVEELEMREDGAAAEEQLAEMMEDLLVQS